MAQSADFNRQLTRLKLARGEDPIIMLDRSTRTGEESTRLGTTIHSIFVMSAFVRQ